jgi:hypothetical protein
MHDLTIFPGDVCSKLKCKLLAMLLLLDGTKSILCCEKLCTKYFQPTFQIQKTENQDSKIISLKNAINHYIRFISNFHEPQILYKFNKCLNSCGLLFVRLRIIKFTKTI